jgi:hypothetical protein
MSLRSPDQETSARAPAVFNLRRQLAFLPPAALFHLIQPALLRLRLAQRLTALESLEHLCIDFGAAADPAPEQRQLVVTLAHFRTDMGDEDSGIDARVDPVQGAADLIGFAVIERPESTIGAPVTR